MATWEEAALVAGEAAMAVPGKVAAGEEKAMEVLVAAAGGGAGALVGERVAALGGAALAAVVVVVAGVGGGGRALEEVAGPVEGALAAIWKSPLGASPFPTRVEGKAGQAWWLAC